MLEERGSARGCCERADLGLGELRESGSDGQTVVRKGVEF